MSEKLLSCTYKNTKEPEYTFTKAKVIKVYDGDTFWIAAETPSGIYKYRCRLYGIDCAEIKDKKSNSQESKKFVSDLLLDKIIDIEVLNGKQIKESAGGAQRGNAYEGRATESANDAGGSLVQHNHASLAPASKKSTKVYTEKYGRLLVNIRLSDGSDLRETLINKGYGKAYYGGKKE